MNSLHHQVAFLLQDALLDANVTNPHYIELWMSRYWALVRSYDQQQYAIQPPVNYLGENVNVSVSNKSNTTTKPDYGSELEPVTNRQPIPTIPELQLTNEPHPGSESSEQSSESTNTTTESDESVLRTVQDTSSTQ